ncbi:MAG: ATP-dependent Clp protease adaptor ClpS [Phycisphaerales bacterium]|nr:ATP-dependent Clp protease adaptor ClpS [Phycisphaerales bacterium]
MEVVEREVKVQVRPALRGRPKRRKAPKWHLVLLDSDTHTYEYVIIMLRVLFGHSVEHAFELARTVDKRGSAIIFTSHREVAELKLEQVHGFGADPLMGEDSSGPMRAVLRPADDGDDE